MKFQYFECACHSPEHTMIFHFDEEDKVLYISTFLNSGSFLQRVVRSIKYVFGYKCKYGHFDEFIFDAKNSQKLINLLEKIKE